MVGMTTVTHQPRVAWNAARAFVIMAEAPYYQDFAEQVWRRLGPDIHDALATTRQRLLDNQLLTGGDRRVADIERGAWRVRMEELLRERPDLTDVVLELSSLVLRY
jgi:hypothetical protein